MSAEASVWSPSGGWLRNPAFDSFFILGLLLIPLSLGVAAVFVPALLWPLVLADVWILGYHHVLATYTRLAFDKNSLREHFHLAFSLLALMLIATFYIGMKFGVSAVVSIYLYWQWFHYTRQSWGVACAYRRLAKTPVADPPLLALSVFYAVPVFGILYRSWQSPGEFLRFPVMTVPVADGVLYAAGVVALALSGYFLWTRTRAWVRGELSFPHTLYMLSHFGVFLAGYVLIDDITTGWLVVNMWHNAQYILFVWLYNNKKFSGGRSEGAPFLSTISQTRNAFYYFAFCLGLSTLVYLSIRLGVVAAGFGAATVVIIYQALNFHHYVVDSVIWKRRAASSVPFQLK